MTDRDELSFHETALKALEPQPREPVPFVYPEGSIQQERSKAIGKAVPVIIIIVVLGMLAFPAWILGTYLAGFQSHEQRYALLNSALEKIDYKTIGKVLDVVRKDSNHMMTEARITVEIKSDRQGFEDLKQRVIESRSKGAKECRSFEDSIWCGSTPTISVVFDRGQTTLILID